jgi:hypothetical protein
VKRRYKTRLVGQQIAFQLKDQSKNAPGMTSIDSLTSSFSSLSVLTRAHLQGVVSRSASDSTSKNMYG